MSARAVPPSAIFRRSPACSISRKFASPATAWKRARLWPGTSSGSCRSRAVDTVEEACRDADIVIEATRLERPQVLIEDGWLKPGSLLVTYGWVMAIDPRTVASVDKRVVDDWAQCRRGGALHPLIIDGALRDEHIHAEIGQIICGERAGRSAAEERILFWHRGFAISDIVLGSWIADRAKQKQLGQTLTLWDGPDE
jgi:alanine dehydrogenase